MMSEFQVSGTNKAALFTLKIHRGDGMALIAMDWKTAKPPLDFVGFAIEYKEPKGTDFFPLNNRIAFPNPDGSVNPKKLSTLQSPIQKFRWVHFPRNANLDGEFIYRVKPVFMNDEDGLSYGEPQQAAIQLRRETYPGQLNVTFTRGFVSSQAFVERYEKEGSFNTLIPGKAKDGLKFKPTHPRAKEALAWMGFEAREAILESLDQAIEAKAQVRVVAYDLSEPEFVKRLQKIGRRLRIIIDDSKEHKPTAAAETQAAKRLTKSAGAGNVKRQHMGSLQHNKMIVVDGNKVQKVVCGSTNFSWRGFYVQSNNAVILEGKSAVGLFKQAFDSYWNDEDNFGDAPSAAKWANLGLSSINARVTFSPHSSSNAVLEQIANDVGDNTKSSLLYSLAFLYQTPGVIQDAIKKVSKQSNIFVYGISDKTVGGLALQRPDGNVSPVYPAALEKNLPAPFSKEPKGGGGNRMHHKFMVIDFDKPSARVYFGSYNFSIPADRKNGENLVVVRDRRIAVSYMIEALRIFDHYHFRVAQLEAKKKRTKLQLKKPPRRKGEKPWWEDDYKDARKIRDRELFS
ncbi:phospholipase D-like domain-containing protein [Bradyrhizobium yuanmingense]|uniref:phospholipase D-like domain-containing protein n=1 Tax=Bradyrhizobium yuanmingense TaxID=108015 RepID=UPI00192BAB5E|nr:phospholipase D-like domain-containing protein [Bradyrhizobium yuanmingense]